MPPKGNKQAIADRRSQKQQKLQEQWDEEEESWDDSQAEEVSDEEEMESWESLDEELEDKPPKDEEEEIIASAAAPSSKEPARSQPPTGKVGPSPPRPGLLKASRRWDTVSIAGSPPAPVAPTKRSEKTTRPRKEKTSAIATRQDTPVAQELRKRIFPTLYAIFQQSRGQQLELKVKNRSLRSLTRSCLYHRREDQLQRTLEDAEALFNKYYSVSFKD
ncbi:protein 33K [Human adenovirus 41]|uniref:Protein 33K n=1 Tax=Human adenovirus F serotype 41 TaxID=10524 RepID=A0A3G8WC22_ADE41|nr:protein 33K [Human adenovirus 41]WEM02961.1 33K [Human mastadenovirus F]WEM02995.1 33K [Human mastadenovirus F]WEM03060.1 33K [Human mastadenovirus F]